MDKNYYSVLRLTYLQLPGSLHNSRKDVGLHVTFTCHGPELVKAMRKKRQVI